MKENTQKRSAAVCIALFAVYGVLTLIGALRHELWFDEAQAWVIARDNDIAGIISMLKYEGHPPLWHFVLYIFAHLGFGCEVIPLISWAFSVIAAGLILFKFPLTTPLKAAIVFSNGFLFYNSVISRVYCLILVLLCLIALLYPNRKKHPILFGTLVALLANTHIFVCGIVGMIGIYMLIDLWGDWKENSAKQNVLNLIGLGIAGLGVLLLVIPLIGSLSSNSSVVKNEITIDSVITGFTNCLFNVSNYAVSSPYTEFLSVPFAIAEQVIMIAVLILMRHWRKGLLIELTYILFYIITCEIIWMTIPNRAAIFLFSFAITFVIAKSSDKPMYKEPKANIKADSKLIQGVIDFLAKCDRNTEKTCSVLLTIMFVLTVPSGAAYLVKDYGGEFCPSRKTAEYIRSELEEDAVFVSSSDYYAQLSAYLPEYKFYALDYGEFYTYTTHMPLSEKADKENIYSDLSGYEHIYYINSSLDADHPASPLNLVHNIREGIPFGVNVCYLEILKVDIDQLV